MYLLTTGYHFTTKKAREKYVQNGKHVKPKDKSIIPDLPDPGYSVTWPRTSIMYTYMREASHVKNQ